MEPRTIDQLLSADPLASMQAAIVTTLASLNPGLNVVAHPGKVDVSELVKKTVVNAPGVGIGWSRIREGFMIDGAFLLAAEWVAYVVAEAKAVNNKRVEKEAVGLAIGARLLSILADQEASLWGLTHVLPVEMEPRPEVRPLFTVRDASQGVAYYTVTWTQVIADLGTSVFPTPAGTYDEAEGVIRFGDEATLDSIAKWLPAKQEPDDA